MKRWFLIGCGGIGSYVANLLDKYQVDITLTLVDGDDVEEKNLPYTTFTREDIGENKAKVLALRHNKSIVGNWNYIPTYIFESHVEKLCKIPVIITTDSFETRSWIHKYCDTFIDGRSYDNDIQIITSASEYRETNMSTKRGSCQKAGHLTPTNVLCASYVVLILQRMLEGVKYPKSIFWSDSELRMELD